MKSKIFAVIAAMFVIIFLTIVPAVAENFRVVTGNSLWRIAELCDQPGESWKKLAATNPQLPEPVKKPGGITDVKILPDQVLALPEGWAIKGSTEELVLTEEPVTPSPRFEEVAIIEIVAPQEPLTKEVMPIPPEEIWPRIMVALVVLAAVFLVFWLALGLGRTIRDWYRNPDRFTPVISGGLNADPQAALRQLEMENSSRWQERRIVKAERGILVRSIGSGSPTIKVGMAFGDDINRTVHMRSGDSCHRVTLSNSETEYYRSHCGNLVTEVKSGKFTLPQGWHFRVEESFSRPEEPTSSPTNPTLCVKASEPMSSPVAPKTEPVLTPKPLADKLADAHPAPTVDAVVETSSTEVSTPVSAPEKPIEYTVSVTLNDGKGSEYTVSAKASTTDSLPTKVERVVKGGEDKIVILFPRDRGAQD